MEPLFQTRRLTAGYGAHDVLRGVDLEVRPGELWAVLGPNGAGKSTLVRAGMGLLPARSGEVRLGGVPLASVDARTLAQRVAWVPQSSELAVGFTALELVLMGRSPHLGRWGLPSHGDVERARAVLEELDLSALATRPVTQLSGGERRLVFLARALLQEPQLLWLDEPTAFLDLRHQIDALEKVRLRTRAGMAAIAVLHDVNLALAYADRVLLLKDGQVQATGTPHDVGTAEALAALYGVPMVVSTAEDGQRLVAPRLRR